MVAVGSTDGNALDLASGVAVSHDGGNVYVASQGSHAVAIFDRAGDGVLTQKRNTAGCVSETGSGGSGQHSKGAREPLEVVASAGGNLGAVYVASEGNLGAVYARGCLSRRPQSRT